MHPLLLPPADARKVLWVADYLEACNKLFEQGLIGHVRIPTYPNKILEKMEQDYFFSLIGCMGSFLVSVKFSSPDEWLALCKKYVHVHL